MGEGEGELDAWTQLGGRLASLRPEKFRLLLVAMAEIVEAEEFIASFEWKSSEVPKGNRRRIRN
ncbi:MAG TPA: hypothetical protein VN253_24885 [Kofleriaceae bacterium]|nr:hypothetical protein [Kofleriaceae bacterium]